MPSPGLALAAQERWPSEPESPSPVVPADLARALQRLCGSQLRRRHAETYAGLFIEHGSTFDVDPFLLAALSFRHSRCFPTPRDGHRGGLIALHYAEHAPFVRDKAYHYWVLKQKRWVRATRALPRFSFAPLTLRRSEPSVYFAAALLSIYQEQCPDIDSRFGSVPHRDSVSHLVWGDTVTDAGSEERILTDRRRLIQYYLQQAPDPVGELDGMKLFCPLDGLPRKITSGLGDVRGEAHHAHRGVDFESSRSEPVRAMADGRVIMAGVHRPGRGSRPLPPERSSRYPRGRMGRGGLYVLLQHAGELTSGYMHLDSFVVRTGQAVKGGQLLGTVGRTGIRHDPAHLHFEVRRRYRALNPVVLLGASVFPPEASYLGQAIKASQPKLWRKARYRRQLRRQAAQRARQNNEARAAEAKKASGPPSAEGLSSPP